MAMTVIPLPFEVHTLFHHAVHPPLGNLLPPGQSAPILLHSQVFVLKCAVLLINARNRVVPDPPFAAQRQTGEGCTNPSRLIFERFLTLRRMPGRVP